MIHIPIYVLAVTIVLLAVAFVLLVFLIVLEIRRKQARASVVGRRLAQVRATRVAPVTARRFWPKH